MANNPWYKKRGVVAPEQRRKSTKREVAQSVVSVTNIMRAQSQELGANGGPGAVYSR
jgi:hypothetical protein